MNQLRFTYIFIFTFLLNVSFAQDDEERSYVTRNVADSMMRGGNLRGEHTFEFPNINTIPYYYDNKQLNRIKELRSAGNKVALKKTLQRYIKNFGIRNFSEDTHLLWMLAQLYEELKEPHKAEAAYSLVLKHHKRNAYPEVKKYLEAAGDFNDLTEDTRDIYVPLDYYYELVQYRKHIDTLKPPKSVLTNMGQSVNARNTAEYGPSISVNDKLLVFTKKTLNKERIGNSAGDYFFSENLYMSQGYDDGWWDDAVPLPQPINSGCNEGSATVSRGGDEIFFARCMVEEERQDCSDCLGSCDLYFSKKKDEKWSKPKNLGKGVNTVAWESHPSLSYSGDTLFFASNRPGGFGLSDIWFTYRMKGDKWSPAENMGPVINTIGNEFSPFVDKKHPVFYFSSNGQLMNFGDPENNKTYRTLDIYKTRKRRGLWLEPDNVGPLVNGTEDEYYFSIDSKAEKLYYARTEDGVDDKLITDLYSFPVPMEAQPTATVRLHGTLEDKETGKPYKGIVSVIDLENGIEVAPKEVRKDGTFDFELIDHQKYLLIIQGDEFFRIEKLFELNGDTTITSKATSVRNRKLQFTTIVFKNASWDILPEMEDDLWNVINFLIDNPEFHVDIEGHTDSDGNAKANQELSQKRADAIKQFIITEGKIEPDRVGAIGYGSSKPIRTPEVTEEDKRINRRVEFEIIHESKVGEEGDDEVIIEEESEGDGWGDGDWGE